MLIVIEFIVSVLASLGTCGESDRIQAAHWVQRTLKTYYTQDKFTFLSALHTTANIYQPQCLIQNNYLINVVPGIRLY